MQTTTAPQTSTRIYFLDWLRVLVIAGVFIGHVLLPFTGNAWVITANQVVVSAVVIALLGNQFGMPLLFLISGAGAYFSLRRRTPGRFVRERFLRLIVPYVLFAVLLSPIQAYLGAVNHGRFQGTFWEYLGEFFNLSGFSSFDFRWAGHYGYHLWFLVFLFVFAIITVPVFNYLRSPRGQRVIEWLVRLTQRRGSTLLFALPIALSQIVLRLLFPAYQSWADFVFWLIFYIYGYLFFAEPRLRAALVRDGNLALAAAIASLVAVGFIGWWSFIGITNIFSLELAEAFFISPLRTLIDNDLLTRVALIYALVTTLISLNAWAFVTFFVFLGQRFFSYTSETLNRLSDLSMPFYIIHHPVIVVVGFFVVQLLANPFVEIFALGASALLVTLGIIALFISPYDPLRVVLGMRPKAEAPSYRGVPYLLRWQVVFVVSALALASILTNISREPAVAATEPPPPPGWNAVFPGGDTICAVGDPYRFFVRYASGDEAIRSDKLLIYFQAGGACWNAETCRMDSMVYDISVDNREMSIYDGIFNFDNPLNPILDYDFVFVSYCTGDVHTGDAVVTYDDFIGNSLTIYHKGFSNAQVVLDWTYERYAAPSHVLVTGSSAGALGAIYHAASIMEHYRDARVTQFGDGFVGVMPAEWDGIDTWNTRANMPPAIRDQVAETADQFVNSLYTASAGLFPQHMFGQFSTGGDAFQVAYYNFARGDIRAWADSFHRSLDELAASLPNYRDYISPGFGHTTLAFASMYTREYDGVRFIDWLTDYVNGRPVESVRCARGGADCP